MDAVNDADRYLLARIKGFAVYIANRPPSDREWHWRHKEPAVDPVGPTGMDDDSKLLVSYHSSLADLEAKGLLWRGNHPLDRKLYGWGATTLGLKLHREIKESGMLKRWQENERFWRGLADAMSATQPSQPHDPLQKAPSCEPSRDG